jgi:hypothetical protein
MNLGPWAQGPKALFLSRPGAAGLETSGRGHADGGLLQRRWKPTISGIARRPESSAQPPHQRSIGAGAGQDKAQEQCKGCGELWEGWKRGPCGREALPAILLLARFIPEERQFVGLILD